MGYGRQERICRSCALYVASEGKKLYLFREQYRIWVKSTYWVRVSLGYLPFPILPIPFNLSKRKRTFLSTPLSALINTSLNSWFRKINSSLSITTSIDQRMKWWPLLRSLKKRKTVALAKKQNASRCIASASEKAKCAQNNAPAMAARMTSFTSTRSAKPENMWVISCKVPNMLAKVATARRANARKSIVSASILVYLAGKPANVRIVPMELAKIIELPVQKWVYHNSLTILTVSCRSSTDFHLFIILYTYLLSSFYESICMINRAWISIGRPVRRIHLYWNWAWISSCRLACLPCCHRLDCCLPSLRSYLAGWASDSRPWVVAHKILNFAEVGLDTYWVNYC